MKRSQTTQYNCQTKVLFNFSPQATPTYPTIRMAINFLLFPRFLRDHKNDTVRFEFNFVQFLAAGDPINPFNPYNPHGN